MRSSQRSTSPGLLARTSFQLIIILAAGTALGLIFNTFNPDGIPLVKKKPALHQR